MFFDIEFKHEARVEIKEIILWYEGQNEGLGHQFETALEQLFIRMRRLPEIGEQIRPQVRRRQVSAFPYFVLYRIFQDRLLVLGVFHQHRDPKSLKDRIDMNGHGGK